jgi:hypothetical protein
MEYVEVLLMLDASASLQRVGPRLGPLAPASVSELFKTAPKAARLASRKVDLERRLRINPRQGAWTSDDDEYKVALLNLVEHKLLE